MTTEELQVFYTELERTHLAQAAQYVADEFLRTMQMLARFNDTTFNSPLEVVFWLWWCAFTDTHPHIANLFSLEAQAEVTVRNGERYRTDFLVTPDWSLIADRPDRDEIFARWTPIAIELDGHAFHERTPEQVALRDRRDRALQAEGWKIFHFSFAEFTADPIRCIREIAVFTEAELNRVRNGR